MKASHLSSILCVEACQPRGCSQPYLQSTKNGLLLRQKETEKGYFLGNFVYFSSTIQRFDKKRYKWTALEYESNRNLKKILRISSVILQAFYANILLWALVDRLTI